jgi:AAA domain
MRIAVSGAHATGKSTLIAGFLARRPGYRHEAEAYETLADDIDLTEDGGPTPEGLDALLRHTIATFASLAPDEDVIVERSPVDYLAYAAASRRLWPSVDVAAFLDVSLPGVRQAVHNLDLIVLVPVSDAIGRPDEDARFRKRVDRHLRRALIDDDFDVFGGDGAPRVVELSPVPSRRLSDLLRLVPERVRDPSQHQRE